jgi:tryptophanyl-tRNA synthetase
MRERILEIRSNDAYLREVVGDGSARARASADETLRQVREIMGIRKI